MLADFFTKLLQGRLFNLFWDVIMGYKPISELFDNKDVSTKKRVEVD